MTEIIRFVIDPSILQPFTTIPNNAMSRIIVFREYQYSNMILILTRRVVSTTVINTLKPYLAILLESLKVFEPKVEAVFSFQNMPDPGLRNSVLNVNVTNTLQTIYPITFLTNIVLNLSTNNLFLTKMTYQDVISSLVYINNLSTSEDIISILVEIGLIVSKQSKYKFNSPNDENISKLLAIIAVKWYVLFPGINLTHVAKVS